MFILLDCEQCNNVVHQYAFWDFCSPQILAKFFLGQSGSPFQLVKHGINGDKTRQKSPNYGEFLHRSVLATDLAKKGSRMQSGWYMDYAA